MTQPRKKRLFPFQKRDAARIRQHGWNALVASAQGTGKTIVTLTALRIGGQNTLPAVVVAPTNATVNWMMEAKTWFPTARVVLVKDGYSKLPQGDIYIVSWDLLRTRWKLLVRRGVKVVVADEAHYAVNESLRGEALRSLAKRSESLMLLTGTPLVNKRRELKVLQGMFGKRPYVFIRRLLSEVAPGMPPKRRAIVPVQLPSKVLSVYREAEDNFSGWLTSQLASFDNAGAVDAAYRAIQQESLTKINYLRQILGEGKVPAALDLVAHLARQGKPVVVFCHHQVTLQALRAGLVRARIRHVIIEGDTLAMARYEAVQAFQAFKAPVFLATRAAKEAITLTAARHVIFVERWLTGADHDQAEDRLWRFGCTGAVTAWYLHAHNTFDGRLHEIITNKRKLAAKSYASEVFEDTNVTTLNALLKEWDRGAPDADKRRDKVSTLGTHGPPKPIPHPAHTHVLLFTRKWSERQIKKWARLHGYKPKHIGWMDERRIKVLINHKIAFQPGTFETKRLGKGILAVTGATLRSRSQSFRDRKKAARRER
jgi:SNF2 family DNA or RNA helicase